MTSLRDKSRRTGFKPHATSSKQAGLTPVAHRQQYRFQGAINADQELLLCRCGADVGAGAPVNARPGA